MSRIAVRQSNGDDVEKFLPLVGMAMNAVRGIGAAAKLAGKGIKAVAGKTSIGRGVKAATGADGGIGSKLMAGAKAAGQQHMANKVGAKATGGEGGEGGGEENLAGKFVAQQMSQQADNRREANQQTMQNNQAMAEKAKANSQISTGEPMDMSWRMLKDWNWHHSLRQDDINAIIDRTMKDRKKTHTDKHFDSRPTDHHNDGFNKRFHPHQKMPDNLDKYGILPTDIAHTMANMYLENHPELKNEMGREITAPNKNEKNTPGMSFRTLTTDNPIVDKESKHVWADYNPLFVEHNPLSGPRLHSQVSNFFGDRAKAQNRHNLILTRNGSFPHTSSEHRDFTSTFNLQPPFSDVEEKPKRRAAPTTGWIDNNWTPEEQKEIDARNIRNKIKTARMSAEKQAGIKTQQEEREQGEISVKPHPVVGLYTINDPAYGIKDEMITPNSQIGQGYDYYHDYYQNQQQNVQTGEPMNLAWRLLKN